MTMTAESFLLGGEGIPSAFNKEDGAGTRRGGTITEQPELRQQTDFETGELLTWDDGSPRMQLIVTVQTDLRDPANPEDDGRRRFYIKGDLQKATRDTLRAQKSRGLEVGGQYFVTRIGQDEPKKRGMSGAWLHKVEYTPAAATFFDSPSEQPAAAATTPPAAAAPSTPPAPATTTTAAVPAAGTMPYPPHLAPEVVAGLQAAGIDAVTAWQKFPPPAA